MTRRSRAGVRRNAPGTARRAVSVVAAVALLAGVAGCNKGRSIIAEATKLHDSGNTSGAVDALERVQKDAPGTPEVEQAKKLAVDWLTESARKAPKGQYASRRQTLDRAVTWDPSNAQVAVLLCEVARDEGGFPALKKCLDALKTPGIDETAKGLRDDLAKHDQDMAARRERKDMLFSSLADDWKALLGKSPEAGERDRAQKKLDRYQSLCTDAREFTLPIVAQGAWMEDIVPSVRSKSSLSAKLARIDAVQFDSGTLKSALNTLVARLYAHPIKPGEESVRSWLGVTLNDIAAFHESYSESLKSADTIKKMTLVVLVDDFVKTKLHDYIRDLKTMVEKPCAALGTPEVDLGADNIDTGFSARKTFGAALDDAKGVAACYGEGLLHRPSLEGLLRARVVVGIDGKVDVAEDAGSDIVDDKVQACALKALRTKELPSPPLNGEAGYRITCALVDKEAKCDHQMLVPQRPAEKAGAASVATATGRSKCNPTCFYNGRCQILSDVTAAPSGDCCKPIKDDYGCSK